MGRKTIVGCLAAGMLAVGAAPASAHWLAFGQDPYQYGSCWWALRGNYPGGGDDDIKSRANQYGATNFYKVGSPSQTEHVTHHKWRFVGPNWWAEDWFTCWATNNSHGDTWPQDSIGYIVDPYH